MLNFINAKLKNRILRLYLKGRSPDPIVQKNLLALHHLRIFQPALSYSYVVVDLETTGLDIKTDRAISIGAFRIRDGRVRLGDMFNRLINPERNIPPESIRIHGIVPDMIKDASTAAEAIDDFLGYLGEDILIAHHAAFDLHFLNRMMADRHGFNLQNLVIDTLPLCSRILFPQPYAMLSRPAKVNTGHYISPARQQTYLSLDSIAGLFGIKVWRRHTAVGDALATAMIFQRILSKMEKAGKGKLIHLINSGAI
ncbi:MAG: 3'-5' exonuclease [Desulfobacterales bacterium]|nr:3'-5' exonuclease [Desulfobacterales bacterium]